ncbi:class I histocompatibility antigen, F10 alpha chain-like isoform 1-T2 [Discoglossus pictus]
MYRWILLLILEVSGVYCGSHYLRFFLTGVTSPGHGLPEYSMIGYLDDIEIERYTSDTGAARPMVQWMETVENEPEFWDGETQKGKSNEAWFKHNVRKIMTRFNQTGGFHSYQWLSSCGLNDDGSIGGFMQHGYDGRDFMVLDMDNVIYIPLMSEAQIITERWNRPEDGAAQRRKMYLEEHCINWLRKFSRAGRDVLERKVRPGVKVSQQQSDGVVKLHCWVYGFYPRDVDVKWVKNGLDDVYSEEAKQILPNPDGTYQTRVTVEVTPQEGDSYECHVDHSSLDETMMMIIPWDPPTHISVHIIIGVVVVVLISAIAGTGFVVYRKKSGNRCYAAVE